MLGLLLLIVVVLVVFVGLAGATESFFGGLVGAVVVGAIGLFALSYTQIDEGHVGIPVTFGTAKNEAVGAGVHFAAPWTTYVELNTREEVLVFEGNNPEDEARGLDDITMQTQGGGSFDLDARVRVNLPVGAAVDVWRQLGTGYIDTAVIPAARECLRDSSVNMDLTEAITTSRPEIASLSEACLREKLTDVYGINVISVELGGTEVPTAVQEAINAKQGQEQARQAAEIELETSRVDAQRQAVEALATSDAEQIIACGGETQVIDGETVVVPNETCEDQFSQEYLQWLFLQNMGQVDNLVVIDPRVLDSDAEILIPVPTGGNG